MTYWTTVKYIHLSRKKTTWISLSGFLKNQETSQQAIITRYKCEINCYVIKLHIFHIISLFAVSLSFLIIIS